jgi:hypothetical protein
MTMLTEYLGRLSNSDGRPKNHVSLNCPYLWRLGDFDKFATLFLISLIGSIFLLIAALVAFAINLFTGGRFEYYESCILFLQVGSLAAAFSVVGRGLYIYDENERAGSDRLLTQIPALRNYISGTMLYAAVAISLCPILFAGAMLGYFIPSQQYNIVAGITGILTAAGSIGLARQRKDFIRPFAYDRPVKIIGLVVVAIIIVPLIKAFKWLSVPGIIGVLAYFAIYRLRPETLDELAKFGAQQSETVTYISGALNDAFDRVRRPLFIIWIGILAISFIAASARCVYLCYHTIVSLPANSNGIKLVEMTVSMSVLVIALGISILDSVFGTEYRLTFAAIVLLLSVIPVFCYDVWLQNLAEEPL